jgi:hypothetical protein
VVEQVEEEDSAGLQLFLFRELFVYDGILDFLVFLGRTRY